MNPENPQESDPGPRRALSALHSQAFVTQYLRGLTSRAEPPGKPRLPTDRIRQAGQKVTGQLSDELNDGSAPTLSA